VSELFFDNNVFLQIQVRKTKKELLSLLRPVFLATFFLPDSNRDDDPLILTFFPFLLLFSYIKMMNKKHKDTRVSACDEFTCHLSYSDFEIEMEIIRLNLSRSDNTKAKIINEHIHNRGFTLSV